MAAGSASDPARLASEELRKICDANPVGSDGKRVNGTLDLHGMQLEVEFNKGDIDLSDVNLRGVSMPHCRFERVLFRGSDLTDAFLEGTQFVMCDFEGAILRGAFGTAQWSTPFLSRAVVASVDFTAADGTWTPLESIDWHLALWGPDRLRAIGLPDDHNKNVSNRAFSRYHFATRNLAGFDFHGAKLDGADFEGADLTNVDLEEAELQFANLAGAKITAKQLLSAKNWLWANIGSDELRERLHVPPDHCTRAARKDFRQCDFTKCNFRNNQLAGLDFGDAKLIDANLSGQILSGTNFDGAHLTGANLRDANLKNAKGLVAWQLRGTDVTGAELPDEIGEFKGIEQVGKIAPAAAKQFLAMLAACLYCWLTIASTTDVALILGSATLPLPVVQTPIPIAGFYWFAPMVLITVFLYFQLNLHRMWEALAKLPAIFKDGRRLDERVYPWMLIQKVRAYYTPLRNEYTFVPKLENFLGSALAYYATPVTLLAFGYRALTKHDARLTGEHVALFTVSLLIAMQFHRYASDTFHGVPPTLGWKHELRASWRWVACLAAGAVLWILASRQLTARPANLVDADLSTKPDGWVDGQADISHVKGAKLSWAHLEHAHMMGAFLVGADLRFADLTGANLGDADLRGANLFSAEMRDSLLTSPDLESASLRAARFPANEIVMAQNWLLAHYDEQSLALLHLPARHEENLMRRDFRGYEISDPHFRRANLAGANFEGVRLRAADFTSADLSGAILRGCDLFIANFAGAKLTKADLRGANLGYAQGLTEPQLREAILDIKTKLPAAFQELIAPAAKKKP